MRAVMEWGTCWDEWGTVKRLLWPPEPHEDGEKLFCDRPWEFSYGRRCQILQSLPKGATVWGISYKWVPRDVFHHKKCPPCVFVAKKSIHHVIFFIKKSARPAVDMPCPVSEKFVIFMLGFKEFELSSLIVSYTEWPCGGPTGSLVTNYEGYNRKIVHNCTLISLNFPPAKK